MTNPLAHPWAVAGVLILPALPLLLLTLGALIVALISTCSRSPARREYNLQLIRELASFAKVMRTGKGGHPHGEGSGDTADRT